MSKKAPKAKAVAPASDRRPLLIAAALVVLVFGVFGRTMADGFIYFDDDYYVTRNPIVERGLTADGLTWAFTTSDYFYWQPVTWLSHMLDCEWYGLNPAGHHFTNTAIHAANAVLLFAAFFYMTGALWRSALLAALFAVHPLRVESVAWIAERKDLLAGFFWFACIIAYAWYARQPSSRRYAAMAACFALGLMSKPTTVTLPFALLLLDWWPLSRRFRLLEKVPLLALAAGSSVITYLGQKQMGATSAVPVGVATRLANALLSYAKYLSKTFWPHPLAVLYPYDTHIAAPAFLGAVLLLGSLTITAILARRRLPFLFTGWFWFAGVLVPMIGLVQVGSQSMADRFTYLPSVGLFLILVWGCWSILEHRPHAQQIAVGLAVVGIPVLAIAASVDVGYWKDSATLMRRTVDVTKDNSIALHNLAFSLAADGRVAEAVPYYRESLRLQPQDAKAYYNLGLALSALHQPEQAALNFAEATRQWPEYAEAHYSLGATLLELGRPDQARTELQSAIALSLPAEFAAQAHFRLGVIAAIAGDFPKARDEMSEAIRLKPDFPEAREKLARVMAELSKSR